MGLSKKRSVVAYVLLLGLLLQVLIPGSLLAAFAESSRKDITTQATVTEAAISVTDASGGEILPSEGVYKDLPRDGKIRLRYDFSLPDSDDPDSDDYKAGDFFTIQLTTIAAFSGPVDGKIKAEDGLTTIADLTIDEGLATVTFTDYVSSHSAISGYFWLEGTLVEEVLSQPDPISLEFSFKGSVIRIGVKEAPSVNLNVTKNGIYDAQTNRINWTVAVSPEGIASSVYVIDAFGDNQEYVEDSFQVNGGPINASNGALTFSAIDRELTYLFLTTISSVQTLTYQTKPGSDAFKSESGTNENVTFSNTATVRAGSKEKGKVTASVSLNWIEKSSSKVTGDEKIVRWTVTVNKSNQNISGASITDVIPSGLELVTGSVEIDKVAVTESATTAPGYFTLQPGESGKSILTYHFPDELSGPAELSYQTRATDLDAFASNSRPEFVNYAEFNWTGNVSGIPSDTAKISLGSDIVAKTSTALENYDDRTKDTITWTIYVNRNQVPITGATITDFIPAGQQYKAGSFNINDMSGDPPSIVGTFSYQAISDSATQSGVLVYEFGAARTINTPYTITYQTNIVSKASLYSNGTVEFGNKVQLTGSGILNGLQTAESTKSFNSQVLIKSAESYDYDTKILKWKITVNRNRLPMTNLSLEDTLPAGLEFLPDTFRVTTLSGDPAGGNLSYTTTGANNIVGLDSFTYSMTQSSVTNDTFTFTFDTKVKEPMQLSQGDITFVNKSILKTDEMAPLEVTANKTINNPIIGKQASYQSGGDYIVWAVPINQSKLTLEDISLRDVLQEGLALDLSSVKLYPMQVNSSNGMLIKAPGSSEISPSAYSVTYNSITNTFDFGIPGTITEAYQLEFITDVLEDSLVVSNSISFSGTGKEVTAAVTGLSVRISELGAGGSGATGSIQLIKVDSVSGAPLSGAAFELRNNRGQIIETKVTGGDGKVTFGSLLFKTYSLVEKTPPNGYLLNEMEHKVRLTSIASNQSITIENEKAEGILRLMKETTDGKPLGGAAFALYDASGTAIATSLSDASGEVSFGGIPVGEYTIAETQAPAGYQKSGQRIEATVSVDSSENKVITVVSPSSVKNAPIPNQPFGMIKVTKISEENKPLSGATIGLYDSSDKLIQKGITGSDGEVTFSNLVLKNYRVKEISPPTGYELSEQVLSASLNSGKNLELSLVNKKISAETTQGAIRIFKVDENSQPLPGAVFGIYNGEGLLLETGKSDAEGKIDFTGLKEGTYTIKEIQAPEGYRLSDKGLKVNILTNDIQSFRFRNIPVELTDTTIKEGWTDLEDNPIPNTNIELLPEGELPKTSGFPKEYLYALGLSLIVTGFLIRKKERGMNRK